MSLLTFGYCNTTSFTAKQAAANMAKRIVEFVSLLVELMKREGCGGANRQTETDIEKEKDIEKDADRQTERDREIETETKTQRERHKQAERQTDRNRELKTDKDIQRDTDRQTDRQTDGIYNYALGMLACSKQMCCVF